MGKGQIINNFGNGRYAVKLLQNRENSDQTLALIDTWIDSNQALQDALPPGDPEHKLPMLKLSMASLSKQKEYLLLIPQDAIADAWCADLSDELSGVVATIEINGDPQYPAVNIRPGYTDNAEYIPARDGQVINIRALTPAQAFYFLAMTPGWQKWKPTYRIGEITSISGDTCSITLNDATSSLKGAEYNINQAWDLTDVDIEYMDCNGSAFETGDRVIVQFVEQDFEKPKVIGFEEFPKPCESSIFFFQPYSIGTSNFLGVYNINGVCVLAYDINALFGAPFDNPVYADSVNADLNTLIVTGSKYYNFPAPSVPMWLQCCYRYPIIWTWIEDNIHEIPGFRSDDSPYGISSGSMMAAGGYSVSPSSLGTLIGWRIEQPAGTVNFEVTPYTWVDTDNDLNIDPGEAYPSDYKRRETRIRAVAWHNGELIMAVFRGYDAVSDINHTAPYSDAAMVDCYVGVFTGPIYNGGYPDQTWYLDTGVVGESWIDKYLMRVVFDIATIADFERIVRIICYDGRMFIFKGFPTTLELYDMYGELLAMISLPDEPVGCTKPYILNYNEKMVLCAQWYSGRSYKSPVRFYDIDTLDEVYSVVIPGSTETSNSIARTTLAATNRPTFNAFIWALNVFRRTQSSTPKPVSYSLAAARAAQEHADWCVANSKIEFNENSIDVNERLREFGIFWGGELLAYVVSETPTEEYAKFVKLFVPWSEFKDIEGVGLGVATFPYTCESFTYLGSQVTIPADQRGLIKVYVCDYFHC
jgi:hypothetical protein